MRYIAKIDVLNEVLAWVEQKMDEKDVPMKISMAFLVAVEEIFVNIASYGYKDTEGEVDIDFIVEANKIKVAFTDEGVEFDPLAKPDPDVTLSVEDRNIGGLGIYMVKKSMDGIEYQRKDGKNILTFWKCY